MVLSGEFEAPLWTPRAPTRVTYIKVGPATDRSG